MIKKFNSLQGSLLLHELSFVLLVLITGAVGTIWSVSWQQSSEESLRLGAMNMSLQNIRGELYRQLKEVFDASFLHDSDADEEYALYTENIHGYIDALSGLATDDKEQQAITYIAEAYASFHQETMGLFDANNISSQQQLLDNQLEQYTFKYIESAFSQLDLLLQQKQNRLSATRQKWTSRLMWMAPIPVIVAISLLVMARRFVHKNVVRPLTDVIDGAKLISKGNLYHAIPQMGVSDLVRLAEAINTMADELSQSRDKLIETEKQAALGELVPLVAHNIRNPLAGIRAVSQVTRDEDVSEITRDALTDIIVAVDRLERWVSSLLSYLHPSELHFTTTNLITVADNALSLIEFQLTDKQVNIVREGWHITARPLMLDINLVEQALFNLMQNALEASSNNCVIKLVYQQQQDVDVLIIIDQGRGMKFDPVAEQVIDGETKRLGCGLGIPFALKVIKQHGGKLKYDSDKDGGTAVFVTFPIDLSR